MIDLMNQATPKIYVAGHRGMVSSAIVRTLQQQGQTNFVTRTYAELDFASQAAVLAFFAAEKPTEEICEEMVAHDLAQAKQHKPLKANGYTVNVSVE